MYKWIVGLVSTLITFTVLTFNVSAQQPSSPNAILAQLHASGVTTNGGTTNFSFYLAQLGTTGRLAMNMMPTGITVATNMQFAWLLGSPYDNVELATALGQKASTQTTATIGMMTNAIWTHNTNTTSHPTLASTQYVGNLVDTLYPRNNPSNYVTAAVTNDLPFVPTNDVRYLAALTNAAAFDTAGAADSVQTNLNAETNRASQAESLKQGLLYSSPSDFLYSTNGDGSIQIDLWNGGQDPVRIPPIINQREVTKLGNFSFFDNDTETGFSERIVYLPGSITNLGSSVFLYNTNLQAVYFDGDAPTVDNSNSLFVSCTNTVYVRSGSRGFGTNWCLRPVSIFGPLVASAIIQNGITNTPSTIDGMVTLPDVLTNETDSTALAALTITTTNQTVDAGKLQGYTAEQLSAAQLTYYIWGSLLGPYTNFMTRLGRIESPVNMAAQTNFFLGVTNGQYLTGVSLDTNEAPRILTKGIVYLKNVTSRTGGGPTTRYLGATLRVFEADQTTLVAQFLTSDIVVCNAAKTLNNIGISITNDVAINGTGRIILVNSICVSGWSGEDISVYSQDGNLARIEIPGGGGGVYATTSALTNYVGLTNPHFTNSITNVQGTASTIGQLDRTNATVYLGTNMPTILATVGTDTTQWSPIDTLLFSGTNGARIDAASGYPSAKSMKFVIGLTNSESAPFINRTGDTATGEIKGPSGTESNSYVTLQQLGSAIGGVSVLYASTNATYTNGYYDARTTLPTHTNSVIVVGSVTTGQYLAQWASQTGVISILRGPAIATVTSKMRIQSTGGGRALTVKPEIYLLHADGSIPELLEVSQTAVMTATLTDYQTDINIPSNVIIAATDRLVIKWKAVSASVTAPVWEFQCGKDLVIAARFPVANTTAILTDAPSDGNLYSRKDGAWAVDADFPIVSAAQITSTPNIVLTRTQLTAVPNGEFYLTLTNAVTNFSFDMTTFSTNDAGTWAVSVSGTNSFTFNTNVITGSSSLTWSTSVANDLMFRKAADGMTVGVR